MCHRHRRDTIRIVKESEFLEICVVVQRDPKSNTEKKKKKNWKKKQKKQCLWESECERVSARERKGDRERAERTEFSERMNVSVSQCICERISQRKVC